MMAWPATRIRLLRDASDPECRRDPDGSRRQQQPRRVLVFLAIVAFLYWLVATKSGKAVRSGLLRAIRHESGSV